MPIGHPDCRARYYKALALERTRSRRMRMPNPGDRNEEVPDHGRRQRLSGRDRQDATDAESAAAYKSSIGYAGSYSLDGDWITHHVNRLTPGRTS